MPDQGGTYGHGQHQADERRDPGGGKDQDRPATTPASARPRTGRGRGRGRTWPPGVICESGRRYRRRWRRNRGRGGRGIAGAARAGAAPVSQILSQPACPVRDLGGAAGPPGGIFGDKLHHQGAHIGRHGRRQRRHRLVAACARHVQRLTRERRRPGQALVRDDSQCIQIAGLPGLGSGDPLRRQVPRRPHHDCGDRDGHRPDHMRDAETGDLHGSARGKQQVPRLDITMNQARSVRCLQAGRGLRHDVHAPRGIQGPAGEHAGQSGPVDQFHDQVGLQAAGRLVVIIDVRDVLVPHGCGVPRLGLEPGQGLWLLSMTRVQQLDRDRPQQDGIGRAPHLTEPAPADRLIKPITTGEEVSGQPHQSVVTLISGPLPALDASCLCRGAISNVRAVSRRSHRSAQYLLPSGSVGTAHPVPSHLHRSSAILACRADSWRRRDAPAGVRASDSSTPARPPSRIGSHGRAICARLESGRPGDYLQAGMKNQPITSCDSGCVQACGLLVQNGTKPVHTRWKCWGSRRRAALI